MADARKTMSNASSAAYGMFLWQLTKARHAIKTLSEEAFRAKDRDLPIISDDTDPNKALLGALVTAGRSTRNEIALAIRNGCAGAVLQIAWTLFDAHLENLGVKSRTRGGVRAGQLFAESEQFSRVLWAARNAFAHGFEWVSSGGPRSQAGRTSVEILRTVGFENPSNAGVFDYFMMLSDGNTELFIRRLQQAAKDAALTHTPPPVAVTGQASMLAGVMLLGLMLLVYYSSMSDKNEIEDGVILAFQIGSGSNAKTVPIATTKIGSAAKLRAILEEQAIEALSDDAAAEFREVAARSNAWAAQAEALAKTDVGSERFYRDLLDLCERMDEIYALATKLPNPLAVLIEENGCNSAEDLHALLTSLFEATGDFKAADFRIANVDVLELNKPSPGNG